MMLSKRAYLILIHEYPKSRNFIKEIPEMQSYHFKARVQDFLAPGRFVAGIRDHITVLGSEGFVDFIASNAQVPTFEAKKRKPTEIRGLLPGKKKIFTGIK